MLPVVDVLQFSLAAVSVKVSLHWSRTLRRNAMRVSMKSGLLEMADLALASRDLWVSLVQPFLRLLSFLVYCGRIIRSTGGGGLAADSFHHVGLWSMLEPLKRRRDVVVS